MVRNTLRTRNVKYWKYITISNFQIHQNKTMTMLKKLWLTINKYSYVGKYCMSYAVQCCCLYTDCSLWYFFYSIERSFWCFPLWNIHFASLYPSSIFICLCEKENEMSFKSIYEKEIQQHHKLVSIITFHTHIFYQKKPAWLCLHILYYSFILL
jgi:hypothetical protein